MWGALQIVRFPTDISRLGNLTTLHIPHPTQTSIPSNPTYSTTILHPFFSHHLQISRSFQMVKLDWRFFQTLWKRCVFTFCPWSTKCGGAKEAESLNYRWGKGKLVPQEKVLDRWHCRTSLFTNSSCKVQIITLILCLKSVKTKEC